MPASSFERSYMLRHPQGFTAQRFGWFCVGCSEYRGYVEGILRHWAAIWPDRLDLQCEYAVGEPVLSPDTLVASLPLGGTPNVYLASWVEDEFPSQLSRFLPIWFTLELQSAYVNPAMGRATPSWTPLLAERERIQLRESGRYEWSLKHQP
jgi:hypothetical protein